MINRMEAMTGVDIDGDGDVNDDPPEFTETHKFHVVGGPRAGKSSVIKRIVSHRFDNMPTLNSSFMGVASDGRHLTRLTMPEDVKHAQRGRDILVELQDVVSSLGFKSMLDAPAWHELAAAAAAAEEERRSSGSGRRGGAPAAAPAAAPAPAGAATPSSTGSDTLRSGAGAPSAAAPAGAPAAAGGLAWKAPVRTGMPPPPKPHALLGHQKETAARLAKARASAISAAATGRTNPLWDGRGARGFLVVFDLTDRASFREAEAAVQAIVERFEYDASSRRRCPLAIVLAGNKADLTPGNERTISLDEVVGVLAAHCQSGDVTSQLRRALDTKSLLRAVSRCLLNVESANESRAAGLDFNEVQSVSAEAAKSMQRLRAELDPLHVAASHCTDRDALLGAVTAMAESGQMPGVLHDGVFSPPTQWEKLMACNALTVKYVELSCRTNTHVHILERVALRAVHQLPTAAELAAAERRRRGRRGSSASRAGAAGAAAGDFFDEMLSFVGTLFGGARDSAASASSAGAGVATGGAGGGGADDDEGDDEGEEGEEGEEGSRSRRRGSLSTDIRIYISATSVASVT